jgi:hypothetical protein
VTFSVNCKQKGQIIRQSRGLVTIHSSGQTISSLSLKKELFHLEITFKYPKLNPTSLNPSDSKGHWK